jgi:hypothetical protein
LTQEDYLGVRFPAPTRVEGVVLRVDQESSLPSNFHFVGRSPSGRRIGLGRYGVAQALQLVDDLVANPKSGSMAFDFGGRVLSGITLRIGRPRRESERGLSFPELEIWVSDGAERDR